MGRLRILRVFFIQAGAVIHIHHVRGRRLLQVVTTANACKLWILLLAAAVVTPAAAQELTADACLLRELGTAADEVTVGTLRQRCAEAAERAEESLLLRRLQRERAAEGVRSLLTAHRPNYLMPLSYLDDPNEAPFDEVGRARSGDELDHVETKFQLSVKFSLAESILTRRDRLYFGFTALSFWQAYNRNISSPFRETNYEPELFWTTPLNWGPLWLESGIVTLGMSHQSNGRGEELSRSWNRIYADLMFEKDNLVVSLKPWWRIPEDEKDDPLDASGDDNPDIEKYLGHFEWTTVYRRGDHEWSLMLRSNFDSGKGAARLEWAFPLRRGIRGFAQYYNGYGESLIDYDAHVERFGVGILLTDLL